MSVRRFAHFRRMSINFVIAIFPSVPPNQINRLPINGLKYIYIQGPPKKHIHTLRKKNSKLYVSTKFNCTSQVEYKLQ